MVEIEVACGDHLDSVCNRLVSEACRSQQDAVAEFNGIKLVANSKTTTSELSSFYIAELERQRIVWLDTEEGKKYKAKEIEMRLIKDEAERAGLLYFSVRDKSKWQEFLYWNTDRLGMILARYVSRWANYMEREISAGNTVSEIANRCSHEADLEGMSGSAVSAAASVLYEVWEYGNELPEWQPFRLANARRNGR